MKLQSRFVPAVAVLFTALAFAPVAQAVNFPPSPYLSFADSPFAPLSFSAFSNHTFESYNHNDQITSLTGAGSTWAVSTVGGTPRAVKGTSNVDSVDADDGAIDGSGLLGVSLLAQFATNGLVFTYASGQLPTHVGLVWTDSSTATNAVFRFEAWDSANVSLGVIDGSGFNDGNNIGGTAEDRFFGMSHLGGISKFSMRLLSGSGGLEVDHVQWGIAGPVNPTPSPDAGSTLVAFAAVLGLMAGLRRRGAK